MRPRLRTVVARADAATIRQAFSELAVERGKSRWLDPTNRYRPLPSKALTTRPNNKEMRAYVAASVPLHCADGWAYLGRALAAHVLGDSSAAIHLAYYAELRAALCVLAAQGIGIFNRRHVTIDARGRAAVFDGPTHVVAWQALDEWSRLPASGSLLEKSVTVAGEPLAAWLGQFSGGKLGVGALSENWVRSWGYDLDAFANDRELRNAVSYNPTDFNAPDVTTPLGSSRMLRSVWQLCMPLFGNAFGRLDQHLLRSALRYGQKALGLSGAAFDAVIPGVVDRVAVTLGPAQRLLLTQFLLSKEEDDLLEAAHSITATAGKPTVPDDAQVIARATLLLRLASAASRDIIGSSFSSGEFKFWWPRWSTEHSIWNSADDETQLVATLVGVVDSAITDLGTWEAAAGSAASERNPWLFALPVAIWVLVSTERIAMWGLAA